MAYNSQSALLITLELNYNSQRASPCILSQV